MVIHQGRVCGGREKSDRVNPESVFSRFGSWLSSLSIKFRNSCRANVYLWRELHVEFNLPVLNVKSFLFFFLFFLCLTMSQEWLTFKVKISIEVWRVRTTCPINFLSGLGLTLRVSLRPCPAVVEAAGRSARMKWVRSINQMISVRKNSCN